MISPYFCQQKLVSGMSHVQKNIDIIIFGAAFKGEEARPKGHLAIGIGRTKT
jgi:hypothetical protein